MTKSPSLTYVINGFPKAVNLLAAPFTRQFHVMRLTMPAQKLKSMGGHAFAFDTGNPSPNPRKMHDYMLAGSGGPSK